MEKSDGEIVAEGLFESPFAPTPDELCRRLGKDEAALVRGGLVYAERLRQRHADPGDAYLAGLVTGIEGKADIIELRQTDVEAELQALAQSDGGPNPAA